jgi:Bacterial TniB protein
MNDAYDVEDSAAPGAVPILELSEEDEARIDRMKGNSWIGYDRAISIRSQMDALLRHPRTHRMPNLALIGETNNGKTMLLRNVAKHHNPPEDPNAEKTILPVLLVETPPSPDEGRLYYAMLDRLCAAGSAREPEDSKLRRIKIILQHLETKMILLDDFFNIGAGTPTRRRKFLNALRNLSNDLEMPLVVSGTPETLNALSVDPSIANRFKPVFLPRWKESVEKTLLLKKPCALINETALKRLLIFGEGLLGEIVAILKLLAESAVRSGKESIDADMLTKKNLAALGWVMPSDRSRHLEE